MNMKRIYLAALAMPFSGGVAFAHPQLDHAIPPVGSTVAPSPPELRLFFTQTLNPAQSGVNLTTEGGAPVNTRSNGTPSQPTGTRSPAIIPLRSGANAASV
jgi:methionine-rich copper-binding protein CopC